MVTEPFILATLDIKLLETRREFAKTLDFGQEASLTARKKVKECALTDINSNLNQLCSMTIDVLVARTRNSFGSVY